MDCTVNIRGNVSSRVFALVLLSALLAHASWGKVPVILSTDIGNEIDDQWAVVYMLVNPAFDVQGIISAHAPSLPDPSAHATYLVLEDVVERRLGMVTHPPLFEGSSLPLADERTPRGNSGVDFILEASKRYSKENRLVVLTIGAATDVASAILKDPSVTDRIKVVAMGFRNLQEGGKEYNIENDPRAWRVILDSNVPVTVGSGDVCQGFLSLGFDEARTMVGGHGPVGAWLWQEYQDWYFRNVKPLRKNDFSKAWVIWDIITLAHEHGMTQEKQIARPQLKDDLSFGPGKAGATMAWITSVDSKALWADFLKRLDEYQRTHAVGRN